MRALLNDIRFAFRMFARNPGTTAVAVLSLALAIGPNTTLFSVVDRLFLRPPPIPGLSEVYQVSPRTEKGIDESPSYPDFLDYQAALGDQAALVAFRQQGGLLTHGGRTESVPICHVSENFFSALAVRPEAGRVLLDSDRRFDGEPPLLIGYRLWQRTFDGDPNLPGKSVLLNGRGFRVVGVLPRGFRPPGSSPMPVDVWLPFSATALANGGNDLSRRDFHFIHVWARLHSQGDKPRVEALLGATTARLARDFPRTNNARTALLRSEAEMRRGGTAISLLSLSMVGLVLIIACANIAGVLLAQGEARRREFAVRAAMGARGGRLARQMFTETLLLALMAGAAGALLAGWLVDALPSLMPPLPITLDFDFHLDGRVLAYTIFVSLATAVASGLVPALRVARSDLAAVLKGDAPGARATFWFRSGLLLAQIAVCQFLLAGAGLLTRSYLEQQRLHPGFDPDRKLVVATVFRTSPLDFPTLRDKLRSLPGVQQASYAMRLPLGASGGGARRNVALPGAAGEPLPVGYTDVGPGYFGVMGTRILRGREFQDFEPGRPVIVNECMARRFWGGSDAAMGGFLRVDGRDYQVTAVAEDGRYANLLEETQPWMFFPASADRHEAVLIAAVSGDPKAELPFVRRALHEAAPGIAIPALNTLRQHMRLALFAPQAGAWGTLTIALLGVLLAGVGLYGVVSHSVNRRAHEIGVRMSLGAKPSHVLALVLRQAAWLVIAGSAIGLAGAFAAASVVSSVLYQVSPADPIALAVSLAMVALLALAASPFPARRAVRLDPMTVLRRE